MLTLTWTPIPFVSWIIPVIGHVGISYEDEFDTNYQLDWIGVINSGLSIFGSPVRFVSTPIPLCQETLNDVCGEFSNNFYNLFTRNCHHFVQRIIERATGQSWSVFYIAYYSWRYSTYYSSKAWLRTYLPFIIVVGLFIYFVIKFI
ncbi:hypothetical protein P9112_000984 [Eukaryota sp. TZLM1-RC]